MIDSMHPGYLRLPAGDLDITELRDVGPAEIDE
jgi:hypothetical protein